MLFGLCLHTLLRLYGLWLWVLRLERVPDKVLWLRSVFYIVTGEPFKQSAELTGEPIKMKA